MKGNGPVEFYTNTTTVQGISEGAIGGFWGKLWISTTSHGFFVWSWHMNYVLTNHTHPLHTIFHLLHLLLGQLCQCKGGNVITKQIHPWQLWDEGCQGISMGVE
jgi:hypothetical protein